jgi:hypothetical protein
VSACKRESLRYIQFAHLLTRDKWRTPGAAHIHHFPRLLIACHSRMHISCVSLLRAWCAHASDVWPNRRCTQRLALRMNSDIANTSRSHRLTV